MSLLTNTTDTVSGSSQDPEVTEMASGTDSDTIRDICSYHRSKYYFPLVQNNFGQVPSALSTSFKAPTSDLGDLSVLPEEVLAMIALNLDIDSFRHFRQVNRQARFIATAIPQYQQVLCWNNS
ncbi:hypothetical protein BGZ61DRAFT_541191 [Ilyonectria robusta]|uniref:uncharacterized protein n=1 Tax=Ilyonectria robusta TaxID=1079257 RepID=UPI001E8CDCD1|nr:uncharacterized protein BGZ61DRAFT_541191 [Ilyonectria robusta]KAH8654849.1 hypothetical protein BGZ61DRAFT_541191 [Ilyonectria robusta]